MTEKEPKHSYSADDIQVLEGLEPVRKRPGMYIGSTGPQGLHHLIKEIFDNSRDEAMAGECNHIEVSLLPDHYVRVVDNGRGIPVGIHKKTGVSALETIMTVLHAGGKFGGGGYSVSGGLHGVGASVVNALSEHTKVEVHTDGGYYIQEYKQGRVQAPVKKIRSSDYRGTIVTFKPDIEIFKEIKYNWNSIISHYREQAYLVSGTRIELIDAREYKKPIDLKEKIWLHDQGLAVPHLSYYFEGGIISMVKHYNKLQTPVHKNIFSVKKKIEDTEVEVALQYVDDIGDRIIAFANNISTPGGGMHVTGFKTALTRIVNKYASKNKILSEKEGSFDGSDILEGLTVVVSVKMPEIQFEGQTKDKLGSPEARSAVETIFGEAFELFIEENPDDIKNIIKKATLALRARKAAKIAKDSIMRKGALEGMTLPGKLADCSSKVAADSELFIVEGDSAGGTAKQGRDRKHQAILPLRGKILNVERARLDKMLVNEQVKNLVIALGTSIGETFDLDKIRYHKIIIATDADVDGSHIRTLALTLFYRYFKQVIEAGFLYIAQPPLYKITQGKTMHYVYNEEEKQKILKKLGVAASDIEESEDEEGQDEKPEVKAKKVSLQRYKGLGEMNADELWSTTMNPETRILKQVSVIDIQDSERIFDILMGSDVAPRKAFIQTNAKLAELDI